jgi:hypothetical protein
MTQFQMEAPRQEARWVHQTIHSTLALFMSIPLMVILLHFLQFLTSIHFCVVLVSYQNHCIVGMSFQSLVPNQFNITGIVAGYLSVNMPTQCFCCAMKTLPFLASIMNWVSATLLYLSIFYQI